MEDTDSNAKKSHWRIIREKYSPLSKSSYIVNINSLTVANTVITIEPKPQMCPATKLRVQNWLRTFPKYLTDVMMKFRKGDALFHLIRMVSTADTIQLWLTEYPQYCLDMLRKEMSEDRFIQEIKDFIGLDDDELDDYKNDDKYLISDGFLEHMIIDEGYGEMLPDTLFDVMKDRILAGDIVYAPYYESRMYYGIELACLGRKHNIILKDNEGHYPGVRLWQKRIMDYNELSFSEALTHIENTYGDWEAGCLIEMWE